MRRPRSLRTNGLARQARDTPAGRHPRIAGDRGSSLCMLVSRRVLRLSSLLPSNQSLRTAGI